MLKQPRPEDVGRHFGKDTPLLLILLTRRIVVFLSGTLAAANTRVTRITCDRNQISLTSSADFKPKLERTYVFKKYREKEKKKEKGDKNDKSERACPPFRIIEMHYYRGWDFSSTLNHVPILGRETDRRTITTSSSLSPVTPPPPYRSVPMHTNTIKPPAITLSLFRRPP